MGSTASRPPAGATGPDGTDPLDPRERAAAPMAPERAHGADDADHLGPTFWVGLVLGGAVMGYAVWGGLQAFSPTEQVGMGRWLASSALAHDLILAPIVTIIGLLLAWVLPRSVRGPILGAAALSGIVVLVSWPALRGYGLRPSNSSILPHDYGHNVAIVIGLVWLAAGALIVVRLLRARSR